MSFSSCSSYSMDSDSLSINLNTIQYGQDRNIKISIDNSGYDEYMMAKNARIEESCKTQNMEEDLANLKSEISELKSLLKELVPHG